MLNNPTQVNGSTSLSAEFYNSVATELENTIQKSGQSLETGSPLNKQLIEAIKRLSGNGVWSILIDYLAGSQTLGSDGEIYRCISDTGPTFANPVDPVNDTSNVWTSTTKRYTITIPFDGNNTWGSIVNGLITFVRSGNLVTVSCSASLTQNRPAQPAIMSSMAIPVGYRPDTSIYTQDYRSGAGIALPSQLSPDKVGVTSSFQLYAPSGWDSIGGVTNPIGVVSWATADFIQ